MIEERVKAIIYLFKEDLPYCRTYTYIGIMQNVIKPMRVIEFIGKTGERQMDLDCIYKKKKRFLRTQYPLWGYEWLKQAEKEK